MRGLFSFMLTLSILGTVLTALVWYFFSKHNVQPGRPPHKSPIMNSGPFPSRTCKGCRDTVTDKVLELYSHSWRKQEDKFRKFRSLLSNRCHGLTKAMVTQANTPLGSKVVYDGEKRKPLQVTPHKTFEKNKFNAPLILTFAEDVKKLHIHLQEKQKTCYSQLSKEPNRKTWAQLAKVTLSQMTVFNRKRPGDASLMTVASFVSRDKTALHDDYGNSLSDVERALCQHFSRIEICGKRSRKVAVLLSPTMIKSMELLAEKREHCSVLKENIYMFAIPGCPTSFSGSDCLRLFAKKCGAKCPESLSSTKLRKHITMMSTVLNLNDTDMDLLADFLGHDLQMDKKYYRLPEGTLQLAKITKVLMAMEQGRLNEFKGKGLDQIHISPVECVELDEESDTDLTEETPGRSCEPQERTREAMAGRSGSKKRKWSEEDKGSLSFSLSISLSLSLFLPPLSLTG